MAGGIDWFRWHHGSVTDPKFQLVARKAGARLSDVLAIWAYVLEHASAADVRGEFGDLDAEAIDCLFGFDDGLTAAVLDQMGVRGLVCDGAVSSWTKRQPKREREGDISTERSRAFRQKQRQETPESDDATPCNATQRQETPREEESREEKNTTTSLRSVVGGARKRSPSFDPAAITLPDWLNPETWRAWCQDRKKRGNAITEKAAELQIKKLTELRDTGHTPESVIEHSIASGYQGLFAPKTITQVTTKAGQQAESFRERDERLARERWEQAAGRAPQHAHIIDITPAEPARLLEIEP